MVPASMSAEELAEDRVRAELVMVASLPREP